MGVEFMSEGTFGKYSKCFGTPLQQIKNFTHEVCGFHFWRNFWKYPNIKNFGFKFLEKGHILRPFSGKTPTKMKMLSKNLRLNMFIYIYIIYIWFKKTGMEPFRRLWKFTW